LLLTPNVCCGRRDPPSYIGWFEGRLGCRRPILRFAPGIIMSGGVAMGILARRRELRSTRSLRSDHHAQTQDGKTLALVTGMIPCPLTTFIMSYALARGMLAAGLAVTAAMTLSICNHRRNRACCRFCARALYGAARPNPRLATSPWDSSGGERFTGGAGVWIVDPLPSPRRWSVTWFQPAKK
jgi:hypothetical protein